MDSPTKKFKRATAKLIRDEVTKTRHSETLKYAALEAAIGIAVGFGIAVGYVNWLVY